MNNRTIKVSVDFVIFALEERYQAVKDLWASEASRSLWEQALTLVEECGLGEHNTSPGAFVDNYLVNGDFVSKEDDCSEWLDKTSYKDCHEELNYEGDEFDQWLSDNFDGFWQEYCQDNALIYNDEYACLRF